ncbi:MAG: (2Fe-2S)-binding protein [Proteobacteria bacterium]|nr:(2Fe-2S)-binding protein [Pseudomonadota bacterium]
MIVCSCQLIRDTEIHAAIDWMRAADPATVITPGKIYHALGKAPECGGCMRLFVATMRINGNLGVPAELRGLRDSGGDRHEGRSEGHRLPEPGAAS